jgi:hypothetical protein
MQPDHLTPLERQLAACRPSTAGLDPDAMLFAAGQAAAQRRGLAWPVVAAAFAGLSLVLTGGLMSERSERLALANRLQDQLFAAGTPRPPVVKPSAELPADSYLAARRMLEGDVDDWQVRDEPPGDGRPAPPPEPGLRAWGAALVE